MGTTRIVIVQLDESGSNHVAVRRAHMAEAIERHSDADLVVFPEHAVYGPEAAERPMASIRALLAADHEDEASAPDALAKRHGTSIVYGELVEREGRVQNFATYTNGEERVSYAKTHVHWSEAFEPGKEFPVVRSFRVPLGMLICFDAAFPEVPRILALNGAQLIVNISAIPANFPLKHVHRRVVACSVANQVVTVFANRAGTGFSGGSMVVDATGEVLATAGASGDLVVDVDMDEIERWRKAEPVFAHRRPSLYHDIVH